MAEGGEWEILCSTQRRANHAFMNDLQVVAGWLQLGNIQRAMDYIEETKERVMRESAAMNRLGPDVYGFLHALKIRAEVLGVALTVTDTGPAWCVGRAVTDELAGALWEAIQLAAGKGISSLELIVQPLPRDAATRVRDASSSSPRDFAVRFEAGRKPAIIIEPAGE